MTCLGLLSISRTEDMDQPYGIRYLQPLHCVEDIQRTIVREELLFTRCNDARQSEIIEGNNVCVLSTLSRTCCQGLTPMLLVVEQQCAVVIRSLRHGGVQLIIQRRNRSEQNRQLISLMHES